MHNYYGGLHCKPAVRSISNIVIESLGMQTCDEMTTSDGPNISAYRVMIRGLAQSTPGTLGASVVTTEERPRRAALAAGFWTAAAAT